MSKANCVQRQVRALAETIALDIDWRKAERIDGFMPGFLDAYAAVQDEWERDPKNREVGHVTGEIHTVPIAKRLRPNQHICKNEQMPQ